MSEIKLVHVVRDLLLVQYIITRKADLLGAATTDIYNSIEQLKTALGVSYAYDTENYSKITFTQDDTTYMVAFSNDAIVLYDDDMNELSRINNSLEILSYIVEKHESETPVKAAITKDTKLFYMLLTHIGAVLFTLHEHLSSLKQRKSTSGTALFAAMASGVTAAIGVFAMHTTQSVWTSIITFATSFVLFLASVYLSDK